jgi:hypothetical protein
MCSLKTISCEWWLFSNAHFGDYNLNKDYNKNKQIRHMQYLFIVWILQEKKLPSVLGENIYKYLKPDKLRSEYWRIKYEMENYNNKMSLNLWNNGYNYNWKDKDKKYLEENLPYVNPRIKKKFQKKYK